MHNHPSYPPSLPPPAPGLSPTSSKPGRGVPLLTLAPPAVALGEDLSLGEPGEEHNVRDIWNGESQLESLWWRRHTRHFSLTADPLTPAVVTKASELVKDGERLENLAWRWYVRAEALPLRDGD